MPAATLEKGSASQGKLEQLLGEFVITSVTAYEEATNAGIPTVGVKVAAGLRGESRFASLLSALGATPLGTSAGTGEAIHLIDSIIERSALTEKYKELFSVNAQDATYTFKKELKEEEILKKADPELKTLWDNARRYSGKGCLNAVANVEERLADIFVHKNVSGLQGIATIDNMLLNAELALALERGKISATASPEDKIKLMQRKAN